MTSHLQHADSVVLGACQRDRGLALCSRGRVSLVRCSDVLQKCVPAAPTPTVRTARSGLPLRTTGSDLPLASSGSAACTHQRNQYHQPGALSPLRCLRAAHAAVQVRLSGMGMRLELHVLSCLACAFGEAAARCARGTPGVGGAPLWCLPLLLLSRRRACHPVGSASATCPIPLRSGCVQMTGSDGAGEEGGGAELIACLPFGVCLPGWVLRRGPPPWSLSKCWLPVYRWRWRHSRPSLKQTGDCIGHVFCGVLLGGARSVSSFPLFVLWAVFHIPGWRLAGGVVRFFGIRKNISLLLCLWLSRFFCRSPKLRRVRYSGQT